MLTQEQITLLTEGARCLKVELSDEALTNFSIYIEELLRWGRTTDLISQTEPETIIRKHILDSLAVLTVLRPHGHLLDLGSGAGFPGLPLAIAEPSLAVTLLESRRKRANFLKEVIRKTNLANIQAYEGRTEDFISRDGWRGTFAAVTTRATWNIKEFLKTGSPFATKGGVLLALKGPQLEEELLEINRWLQENAFLLQTVHKYKLPFGKEKRAIAIFSLP